MASTLTFSVDDGEALVLVDVLVTFVEVEVGFVEVEAFEELEEEDPQVPPTGLQPAPQ